MRFLKSPCYIRINTILFLTIFLQLRLHSQDSTNIEFRKITALDINRVLPQSDSGASAVVIADIGKSYYQGDRFTDMKLVYTEFKRVKILKRSGFNIANFEFLINLNGMKSEDSVFEVKGSTFNLENGNIKETILEKSDIYYEKYGKNIWLEKFTMPALKEGSVFDIVITQKHGILNPIRSWNFQGLYPCLYNRYEVIIPPFLQYSIKFQGDSIYDQIISKSIATTFSFKKYMGNGFNNLIWMKGNSTQFIWIKKNVPAFPQESFVYSIKNYVSRVSFQLEYLQLDKERLKHDFKTSWTDFGYEYFYDGDLGEQMVSENIWLGKDIGNIVENCQTTNDKIKAIFAFVRDNYTCKSHIGIYPIHSLFAIYKNKTGNVAEINLLLVAMLKHFNIIAYPAILSTRENGIADLDNFRKEDFNYIICIAYDGNEEIKLDASWSKSSFGKLLPICLNGGARIIDRSEPKLIPLLSDTIDEKEQTNIFISNDEDGGFSGTYFKNFGEFESFDIREEINKISKKDYLKVIKSNFENSINIANDDFDSLEKCELPLKFHCDVDLRNIFKTDLVYFNPVICSSLKVNPLIAGERLMPVEMPYKLDDVYILSMEIPKGYQVDEIPKSTRIKLNENQGFFDYIIQQNPDNIQMNVHLKLNKTIFSPDEYSSLREFYRDVIKKESEQIVFKRIR
jgi:Domain of Unknown Function with PDB structure (DUF3858)